MSYCRSKEFGADGWMNGTYLYFLCCAGDSKDIVYIKIGITDRATKRLYELANNCALRPLTFGVCHVYSRKLALKLEREMHHAFNGWRVRGEWFRFRTDEKPTFSAKRDEILKPHRSSSWPLLISVTGVIPVMKEAGRRSLYFSRLLRQRGQSFRDFQHDSVSC